MINHPEYLTKEGLTNVNKHETHELLNENGIIDFRKYDCILRVLAEYVKWKGKYPVPLKQELFSWNLDYVNPEIANELYEKLRKRLNQEERLRDLRDSHHINKSIKGFLKILKEIINFMKQET